MTHATAADRIESSYVTAIRVLLYAIALVLYLRSLSSHAGIVAAVVLGGAGVFVAHLLRRRRVRLLPVLLSGLLVAVLGLVASRAVLLPRVGVTWWGVEGVLALSDAVVFGFGALACVVVLRSLALRVQLFSLGEVAFVAGSVAVLLADHRHRMINRPRFLSDWAWSRGIDPTTLLVAAGVVVTVVAALLFLRQQRVLKLITTALLLLLLGSLYLLGSDKKVALTGAADALGLSKGEGQSGAGQGHGDQLFKDNYDPPGAPQPVAILILRDDFKARDGLLYLRQRVLSRFNGINLTADPKLDTDVPEVFPGDTPLELHSLQNAADHQLVPTTMYLLVDHPQPLALTHAVRLAAVDNPNPRQFVTSYEVQSEVLSVSTDRLLGHRSIPASWSAAQVRHYTAIPDDPRYAALSRSIVREMDPRFVEDDLAKAFTIKRYLEREGFYTRRSKHASQRDPTASFLFGNMRGYCVHFAHAAVYLFRSQGIAARVALGYAVQTIKRSGGSSILVMSDRAHAWPEIFLDGVGWVTFDIYPEHTDMPPPAMVDYDLERILGELARRDPSGGVEPLARVESWPWRVIALAGAGTLLLIVLVLWSIKLARQVAPVLVAGDRYQRLAYLALLDRLSNVGLQRLASETREQHAERIAARVPHFVELTQWHLAAAFGSRRRRPDAEYRQVVAAVGEDVRRCTHPVRRWLGWLNPVSWLASR